MMNPKLNLNYQIHAERLDCISTLSNGLKLIRNIALGLIVEPYYMHGWNPNEP